MAARLERLIAAVLLGGCGSADESDTAAWAPTSESGGELGTADDDGDEAPFETGIDDDADDEAETGIDPAESSGDEESTAAYDCTPWATAWIGAPCGSDADCSYEGGTCLREDEGFPCGTCSQACEELCPDLEGVPETFCVDGSDVGVEASGHCLSQCSPALLGGDGCRDGYDCAALSRFMDPGTSTGVCVPNGMFEPMTACQQELVDRGVAFVPTTHELDHPDGHPELDCVVVDPVFLYSPVLDVTLRGGDGSTGEVFVACETALAIADTAEIAATMEPVGADEIIHYGTYNCRTIAGTSTLSNHAEARAIDIGGFVLADGQELSVYTHWEDGVASPASAEGQWLRGFTDTLWDTMTWHIILTPEYNADHNDHFHVDLTPDSMFYE